MVFIETVRHLPHACLASDWGNEPADEFSSELRPKVLRAATLFSGPTAAWGTAGFMDEETATLHRGQADTSYRHITRWQGTLARKKSGVCCISVGSCIEFGRICLHF